MNGINNDAIAKLTESEKVELATKIIQDLPIDRRAEIIQKGLGLGELKVVIGGGNVSQTVSIQTQINCMGSPTELSEILRAVSNKFSDLYNQR